MTKELGVRVSAGHCDTSYELMKEAIEAGKYADFALPDKTPEVKAIFVNATKIY